MDVLVLNTGSSSLKWAVLNAGSEEVLQQGDATWGDPTPERHVDEISKALEQAPQVDAVGHRVVHGGARFRESVLVDESVIQAIEELAELAPLHNPAALTGIRAALSSFRDVPHVAAFDSAFHSTLPEPAALYPVPWDWTVRWDLRRFGFHGLSVQYAVGRAAEELGRRPARLVVCHLGAGCSVTAIADGRSIETSMGFTPLEGLMMARRSGSVDPGVLLYLLQRQGLSADELERGLNEESGLLGVSGVSADMRAILASAERSDQRAQLALDMFVHRVVMTVGGMVATLGGLDALVFTGGIGENSATIRDRVTQAFTFLGDVPVLVVQAREDLVILREVKRVLESLDR